ncbi:MAG: Ig-like domain-containing protein [Thermoplasmatales archaeon]|nr:Ig-like domain-containing protein [Thermoplasmatales archaeon]
MKKYLALLCLIPLIFIVRANAFVFCEEATTTTCTACPDVSEIIYEIYNSRQYPFYFVSLVADKNSDANERVNEYNVYGYPTLFFDGGYEVIFGKKSKSDYINAIEKSIERKRANIKISMRVIWRDSRLNISLEIENGEDRIYEGYLKVYVVEPLSRWKDAKGNPFHFALLGYAFKDRISIEKNGRMKINANWNEPTSKENVMAIAVVFSNQSETRYSYPPTNTHPFSAHFVDACVASPPAEDAPPALYFLKKPEEVWGYRNVSFEWSGEDEGEILYSYKLNDGDWSEWSYVKRVEYNLSDGEYEFFLRGKDNIGQISEISYRFSVDTSPPKVVYHYPENKSENIPVHASITIKFSHEMNKSVEIEIFPNAPYSIEWKNEKELILKPYLEHETTYTIKIKNASRTSGQKMAEFYFSFKTSPADIISPEIVYVEPFDSELYEFIKIKFSKQMNTILHNAIRIEPFIPFTYEWKENDSLLLIYLKYYVPGKYNVKITKYMEDKNGNTLDSEYSFSFSITNPSILSTNIINGEENVSIHEIVEIKFSNKMNESSVEKNLFVYPPSKTFYEWNGNRLILKIEFEKGKKYFINISKNAEDARGLNLIEDFSLSFTTEKEIERKNEAPSFSFTLILISFLIFYLVRKRK